MKMLESKILNTIKKYDMLSDCSSLIVAVSGGADSMCLIHFFNKFSSYLNLNNLICAHVNHGIRGAEADRDEEFVREYCSANDIRFASVHYDVPSLAHQNGESVEQCGRRLRYEFFNSLADNCRIATAHNLNDSAETFLFNLARGTGLKGLTGIPVSRDNIIRPLCECTREEIEKYLFEENVSFVTDSTNNCDDYSRNKIRHNVLPVLSEINSSFFNVFLGCINTLSETECYLSNETEKAFVKAKRDENFLISEIVCLDNVLRSRLLMKIAEYFGGTDIEKKHIELLTKIMTEKGAVMLHNMVKIVSDGRYLFRETELKPEDRICIPYSEEKDEYIFDYCRINLIQCDIDIVGKYNSKELSSLGYIDADKIGCAFFRSREEGDRFRYPFAEHSKSLKNLYKEKKISKEYRYGIPLLANENGIIWIDGVGVSDIGYVDENSNNILRILITREVD